MCFLSQRLKAWRAQLSRPLADLPYRELKIRLGRVRRWMPAALVALVVVYQIGPSIWIQTYFGVGAHVVAEILLYGTVGPTLLYVVLEFVSRWLEERETAELQAHFLTQAREQSKTSRRLSDDALQALFAASTLLHAIEDSLPPGAVAQLRDSHAALDDIIERLRDQLLAGED